MDKKLRILVAKPGLDGHDRGARVVARALRDAGFEVIYTGLHQTPGQVAEAALQEDVDMVGLSILSGAHMTLAPKVRELLNSNDMEDVPIVLGGIVPEEDATKLLAEKTVARVFNPGDPLDLIIDYARSLGEGSDDC